MKDVFGIAPIASVEDYNILRPLLQSAGFFIYFWVILIALIFLTPITLENNNINIGKIKFELPFKNSKPVKSVSDFYDNIFDSYESNETEAEAEDPNEAKATEMPEATYDSINTH